MTCRSATSTSPPAPPLDLRFLFGGLRSTGPSSDRLDKWFQSESGLHQNWMRDYDPTTGRYMQADPLGLVDGASVYGYALQSPFKWVDPTGRYTLGYARASLFMRGVPMDGRVPTGPGGGSVPNYTEEQVFDEWYRLELENRGWESEMPLCPLCVGSIDLSTWTQPGPANQIYHPGGVSAIRTNRAISGGHGGQCIFDSSGRLITEAPAAGSADYVAPVGPLGVLGHYRHDVAPYNAAERLGRIDDHFDVRPSR
ncbi:RHS repeat-associated core domain-containing protein [Jannaschia pohangensis]|uniref:RHS repeat-associated core domain-containing protein n=1 Tax=Jannaschia pohangensis TaxID=390807 RepID=UPI003CCBF87B